MGIIQYIKSRWQAPGGYRQVLLIAFPLILSTGSWAVQHFVDRMYLAWYSPEALAAAMPAGMLNFAVMTIFLGTVGYAGTFVAQYYGAKQNKQIGPVIWQAVYVAAAGSIAVMLLIPWAGAIFQAVGHDPLVQRYETTYFAILCAGAFPALVSSALSGFYSGLGKTMPVMWINLGATAVNVVFDYLMIFGHGGFPEMGMAGAAWATVFSAVFSVIAYSVLIFRPGYNRAFHTLSGWRLDRTKLSALLKYGFPNGVQFFLDMSGFTFFILLVGRLGSDNLAATNIAFNVNTIAFMPMIGFGITASVLVGQYLGQDDPETAQYSVYSGFHMTFVYMAAVALLYFFWPQVFLMPYAAHADPVRFEAIRRTTIILLRFVAVYSLFDGFNIIFSSAIKGAGDTKFVMYMLLVLSFFGLVVPSYLALAVFGAGIYTAWTIASAYVVILGLAFYFRFRGGKWKGMRVIEPLAPSLIIHPESPAVE
ncbi:MAG: MATE family efflux transporter [bacterium]|nr:MATE family efflux transporter [bacterium]